MKKNEKNNIFFLDQSTKYKLKCTKKEIDENSNPVFKDMMRFLQESDNIVSKEDENNLSGMLIW